MARIKASGVERMVLLGLLAARHYFNASLPTPIAQRAASDSAVCSLLQEIDRRLVAPAPANGRARALTLIPAVSPNQNARAPARSGCPVVFRHGVSRTPDPTGPSCHFIAHLGLAALLPCAAGPSLATLWPTIQPTIPATSLGVPDCQCR